LGTLKVRVTQATAASLTDGTYTHPSRCEREGKAAPQAGPSNLTIESATAALTRMSWTPAPGSKPVASYKMLLSGFGFETAVFSVGADASFTVPADAAVDLAEAGITFNNVHVFAEFTDGTRSLESQAGVSFAISPRAGHYCSLEINPAHLAIDNSK
jgi:hypothetical protein